PISHTCDLLDVLQRCCHSIALSVLKSAPQASYPAEHIVCTHFLYTLEMRIQIENVLQEKNPEQITYAILSHTWDEIEQTFRDVREIQRSYDEHGRLLYWRLLPEVTQRALYAGRHVGRAFIRLTSVASAYEVLRIGIRRYMRSPRQESPSLRVRPSSDGRFSGISRRTIPLLTSIWHDPRLSSKVKEACAVARENGYDYLWIDSCCIDKTSSSELSEAINSMYDWYRSAAVCYAYLSDVPFGEKHRAGSSRFRSSRWFKRGWTLQELIAPSALTFLSEDWKVIGTKGSLCDLVEDVTSIPEEALLHTKPLDLFSVAERFSWAATR
ncbi:heterokaryon incompatibility protein-domain-containing protein, partial [Dichomitus squalens]